MTVNKENFDNTTSEAEQAAAAWFIKLDVEQNASEDELIEFVGWLRADPIHEQLYERCKFTWGLSTEIENDPDIANYISEISVQEAAPQGNRHWLDRLTSLPAIAAGVIIAAFIGFLTANHYSSNETLLATRYHTAIGEQRSFELNDGSNLLLNTRTELLAEYSTDVRKIILQSGEALFDVAHDPARPFIVVAGGSTIEAIGTRFSIRKDATQVTVLLAEGSVKIEPADKSQSNGIRSRVLMPGEQVIYSQADGLEEVVEVDVAQALQWSVGKLTFSDAQLVDVVTEVNRYTPTKIIIEDPSIRGEKISAYFFVENIDSLLFALDNTFNIEARRNAGKIYLSRKKELEL